MLKKLGKYELIEEVGRGAMGEVYKALDPLIGRPVALKTITSSLVGDPELLERFGREARSAGALEHPNIVTIYELGREGDAPFIAMEYLDGESLEKMIARRALLPILDKVGIIVPVCRALEYAHRRGVVHRDVKPGNVMITQDKKVKVVDFGIARLVHAAQQTQVNMFMGTLSYMSPQLIYGERADERSDIWALGVTFYEFLSYRRAFEGNNYASLMFNIADDRSNPRTLGELVPECPPALELLVARMMEKDVRKRFQSMEEVLFELEPLWETLQQASVSGMIEESENFIRSEEFARAREVLRRALQYDNRNDHAKTLLERVNSQLKLIQIRSQVASIVGKAEKLLREKRFTDAQTELEGALKIDPGSAEARSLLDETLRQAERKRLIQDGLQLARQNLAEGALSQAAEEVQKVLQLDAENAHCLALQNQIQEHLVRREEQRRIADVLQRARKAWAEGQIGECISILASARTEFPNDVEIGNLLQTAEQDRQEQEKQKVMAEARSLLAAQNFEEALSRIQPLAREHQGDTAVHKLLDLVVHEKQEVTRQRKLQSEMTALQSMVNGAKYSEAVARGEKLLKEYPKDADLLHLVAFARSELAQIEQKRKLEETLQAISKKLAAEQFKGAVGAAEKALTRFPGDLAISEALEAARAKLKETENRALLQQRIAEIRAKINKGQHTDAVDLARQTIATLGANAQATQLMRLAEMELAQKREKQEERDKQLSVVQSILLEGRFAEATQLLRSGFESHTLSRKDPLVQQLLKKIKGAKSAPAGGAVSASDPVEEPAGEASTSVERAIHTGATVPQFSSEQIETPPVDCARQEISTTLVDESRTQIEPQPAISYHVTQSIPLEEEPARPEPDKDAEGANETAARVPSPATVVMERLVRFVREYPLPVAGGAVALVFLLALGILQILGAPARADADLRRKAQQLERQQNWPAALAEFEQLAGTHRALAATGRENALRLKKLLDQENLLLGKAKESEASGNLAEAKKSYGEAALLHGDKEQEALAAMARLDLVKEDPPPSNPKPNRAAASPSRSADKPKPAVSNKSKVEATSCQLIPSDVARHLERAERARAGGQYSDAERLYKDVLACDSTNQRAIEGLGRTRQARATDGKIPSSN